MHLLPVAIALVAQGAPAGMHGCVRDEASGAVVVGARVRIVGRELWTTTDSTGCYGLPVAGGEPYRLHVTRLGYEPLALAVTVPRMGTVRVDLSLRATPARVPPVRVVAHPVHDRAVATGGESKEALTSTGRRMTSGEMRDHPAVASVDALSALAVGHNVMTAPEQPTSIHIRGGSSDQTLVLIDGIPVYNPTHAVGAFGSLNPDALDAIALHDGARSAAFGRALSGVITAVTRVPDDRRMRVRSGVSATSARVTLEGPLVAGRSAWMISGRRGSPALFAGRPDRTHVAAAFDDWLVKSATRLGTGTVTLLASATRDRAAIPASGWDPRASDVVASGTEEEQPAAEVGGRHDFDWGSTALGVSWAGRGGARSALTISAWSASFDARGDWLGAPPLHMASRRRTNGLQATVTSSTVRRITRAGVELLDDRATYLVSDGETGAMLSPRAIASAAQPSAALYAEYDVAVHERWRIATGARATYLASGPMLLEPRVTARFRLTDAIGVVAGAGRAYQSVQSLRNGESLAQGIIGAELPVLAREATPVARSDEVTLGVEAFSAAARLTIDGYTRRLDGLVLPISGSGVPFAIGALATGDGTASGIGATLERRTTRLATHLSAGTSRVTRRATAIATAGIARSVISSSSILPLPIDYRPAFANTHTVTAAASYRIVPRAVVRSAFLARWGRRSGVFEGRVRSTGCDAFDGGCELVGTPERMLGVPGIRRLAPYMRWDIGGRYAWTVPLGGRDVRLEGHLTVRNVLDRRNAWVYVVDQVGGAQRSIAYRPFSMLTAGVEVGY